MSINVLMDIDCVLSFVAFFVCPCLRVQDRSSERQTAFTMI